MDTRPLNAAIHKMVAHFVWTLDLLLPLFEDAYERHRTASTEGKRNKFRTDAIEAHLLTLLQKIISTVVQPGGDSEGDSRLAHCIGQMIYMSCLGHCRQHQQKQWEKQIQGPNKVRYHFVYCSI
ncbi:hypothetical protein PVK06_000309 [Gossypium arboreum]|uniref:Uncharacterized protein n=1 Tax=Gossypium arboreum TaxID=29729 RepID=A0ABR0QYX1_GOSAR|nr:hypothetical protein PVK06_000309 [Gossypium arboreum]